MKKILIVFLNISLIIACQKKTSGPAPTVNAPLQKEDFIAVGDILVANAGTDSLLHFDSHGIFKGTLYSTVTSSGESLVGISYNAETEEIIVVVDGSDRVMAIDVKDGNTRTFISNVNLNGNLKNAAQLESGDFLFVESNNVERFNSNGFRITSSGWPKALQTNGSDISALPGGGFVHCSTGSDVVRTYDNDGVQIATASSGIAGTTDVIGCEVDSAGYIYVLYSGTTDTLRKYSPDLGSIIWSYSDTAILSSPTDLAIRSSGEILVLDSTYNYVIEIATDGNFHQILQGTDVDIDDILSTPQSIFIRH